MEIIRHSKPKLIRSASSPGLNADHEYNWYSNLTSIPDMPLWTMRTGVSIATLYELIKDAPEVARCILIKIEDLLAGGSIFSEGTDGAKKKAKSFQRTASYLKHVSDALFDVHLVGWGFILKLQFSEEEVKSIVARAVRNNAGWIFETSSMSETYMINKITAQIMDSEGGRIKDLQTLAADTISPKFDKAGRITELHQRVFNDTKVYSPKDVIILQFYNIGGRVYPFTPAMPLLNDAAQLIDSKAYSGSVIKNKGLPPMALNMPDAVGKDDPNVQFLKKEMKSYRNNPERWGRIQIWTGNVQPIKLDSEANDLEYVKLISHWSKLVITTWGIPMHRYNFADADTRYPDPKASNEGYYRGLSFQQKLLEIQLYNQLWKEFKVYEEFHRGYLIDELRNANVVSMLADRRLVSVEEARRLVDLGLPDEIPKGHTIIDPRKHDEGNTFDEDKDDRGETPIGDDDEDSDQNNQTKFLETLTLQNLRRGSK